MPLGEPQKRHDSEATVEYLVGILQYSTEYSVIAAHSNGTVIPWNEGARRLYGYDSAEVLGEFQLEDLHTAEDVADGLPTAMRWAALGTGKWEGILYRLRKTGQRFQVEAVILPRYDAAAAQRLSPDFQRNLSRDSVCKSGGEIPRIAGVCPRCKSMSARVLIIEDNPENLELMTYLLVAFGHTVVTAENGLLGLQAAAIESPDLIVCDLQLPDIDGFEIAKQLRSTSAASSIPLVALTALAMVGDSDRVLEAGFDGYLARPIDPETFVQQLDAFLLPRHRSHPLYAPDTQMVPQTPATEQRSTILVVDNLPVNLELARSILTPSGYRVVTARGVSEGLARARECHVDLILSDVFMTGESGYDFLVAVRADPELRHIPFILITSTLMDDKDRRRALELGADGFIRRPVEPGSLLAAIGALLQKDEC
jgi:two-component system cell cycle response regulator